MCLALWKAEEKGLKQQGSMNLMDMGAIGNDERGSMGGGRNELVLIS
jgi:hypothetical protein